MTLSLPLLLAGTQFACKAPVEAPAEFGELTLYLYENFDGEGEDGDDALIAGMDQMAAYLAEQGMEPDTDVDDRAVTPPTLPYARLGKATHPDTAEESAQWPVTVSAVVEYTMDQQIPLIVDENQVCIASDTTKYHAQTFPGGDADAFASREQERVASDNEVFLDTFGGDAWMDIQKEYAWVTLSDGREAIIQKGWMPEVAPAIDSDDTSWDQRFELQVWIPEEGSDRVLRSYSLWSSITSSVGEDLYKTSVKNGLDEYYENSGAFIDGDLCDDRDNPYDRE
ncbi:MAG: hypothetical protein VX899_00140 [Myxococcota bacterium]|nr:hypothetical protein [Myxococcota bacterium]